MSLRFSAIFVVLFLSAGAEACASSAGSTSDESASAGLGSAGASTLSGGASSHGGTTSSSVAGASFGGTTSSAGTSTGGTSALGAAGSSLASGGASPGAASGGSGGSAATLSEFAQVNALLSKRCAGSKCHSSNGTQLPFASASGAALYGLLTTPIPSGTAHCVGITLVTPNDAQSPLLEIVASGGKLACTSPKKENVGPMPDKCTTTSTTDTGKCLTADEINVLSAWVLAGAPQN